MRSGFKVTSFQHGLWAETWRVTTLNTKNILIYICFMFAIAALPEFLTEDGDMSGLWVAQAIAAALLAIPAHLTVLKDNPTIDLTARGATMSFVWRGVMIGGLSFLPCLIVMILFVSQLDLGGLQTAALLMLMWLVAGSAAFAKWGTVLPAVITGSIVSFSRASERGSLTFGYSFPRLLLSFGLFTFLQFALAIGMVVIFEIGGSFFPAEGGIDIPLVLFSVVVMLIGAIGLIMTSVILSRAFLLAAASGERGQPIPTALDDAQ